MCTKVKFLTNIGFIIATFLFKFLFPLTYNGETNNSEETDNLLVETL